MSDQKKRLMKVSEFVEEYGGCVNTVRKLIREKKLPAVKFGRTFMIPRDAVERWIAEQTKAAI